MSESKLLERVEAATGPDTDLDRALWWWSQSLSPDGQAQWGRFVCEQVAEHGTDILGQFYDSSKPHCIANISAREKFTASLDAALALVERALPDADFIDVFRDADLWFARIAFTERGGVTKFDSGGGRDTAALALLAALLKATPEQSDV